ncbi:MAG: NUDIX domain-containing protein [Bacteroidota bacterium]
MMLPELTPDDYYLNDKGLMVFTESYHRKRGYCCNNNCKHCPWRKAKREFSVFKNRVRVRVGGLLRQKGQILLVRQRVPHQENFWLPPGGGVEFGESLEAALKREFEEETGLKVKVGELVGVTEFIRSPFHAVECFYEVTKIGGTLRTGFDPEYQTDEQLIKEVRFVSEEELGSFRAEEMHEVLKS